MYAQILIATSLSLPNYAPNPDGLMPAEVIQQAKRFGDTIQTLFTNPLTETKGKRQEIVLELDEPTRIQHVVIMEQLEKCKK